MLDLLPDGRRVGQVDEAADGLHVLQCRRDRRILQQLIQPSRRYAQQDAQLVGGLAPGDLQGRNRGLGLREIRVGLGHVEPRRLAVAIVVSQLRQHQAPRLDHDVLGGVLEPLLGRAKIDVVLGDLGEQQHQGVVVVFDRHVQVGVGRFDGPAEPAPKVEFPGKARAGGPVVVEPVRRVVDVVVAQRGPRVVAERLLRLGEQLAHGNAQLGASFKNAQASRPQGEVLLVGLLNERVEHRVVKRLPPGGIVGRPATDVRIFVVDPSVGHGRGGAAVVRANLEAVGDVIAPTRTPRQDG